MPETPSFRNAEAFDVLFKRLDSGDLTALDNKQQKRVAEQLAKLLPLGDAHRMRLLDTLHCGLDFINDNHAGYGFADARLAESLKAGDADAAIRFYYCRAGFRSSLGTERDALPDVEQGIALARATNSDLLLALGLSQRGDIYSYQGLQGKAVNDLLESQRMYQAHELDEMAKQQLLSIGIAYRRVGSFDKAREYIGDAVEHAQRVGDYEEELSGLIQFGYLEQEVGHFPEALSDFNRAMNLAARSDERGTFGAINVGIGSVLNNLHQFPEALEALHKAEADFAATGDVSFAGSLAYERGLALAGQGRYREALLQLDRAESAFEKGEQIRYQEMLHKAKADVLGFLGDHVQAIAQYDKFLQVHDERTRQRQNEQTQMLEAQFEAERDRKENERLKANAASKDREIALLEKARVWQQRANLAFGALVVLIVLVFLRSYQRRRRAKGKRAATVFARVDNQDVRAVT